MTQIDNPEASGAPPLLQVRNLNKHFVLGNFLRPKFVHAVNEVSFTLKRGEVLSLVGESGSGKSTTARLIARLMAPTRGEILLRGEDILKTEPHRASLAYRREVQMIFQDPFSSLSPIHTIGMHLERPLIIHKRAEGRAAIQKRVHELLATVGLFPPAEVAAKFPYQLSGGQRQRVAIARALAVEPEIIIADEPVSMLDVSIRMDILNLMDQLKRERGISFLYITHDLASARYIGDRTIVMYAGYAVEGAESTQLIDQPAHPYTRLLLSAVPDPQGTLGVAVSVDGAEEQSVKSAKERASLRGTVPSLVNLAAGCPFVNLCPHAMDKCRTVTPARDELGDGHWVRCHLYSKRKLAAV